MSRRKLRQPVVPPLAPLPPPAARLSVGWRWATGLVFCAYLGLTIGHLAITPVAPTSSINYINAPDEAAHLGYVRALAEGHRLPVRNDPDFPTYEWHQPPLYYLLGVALYGAGGQAVRWVSVGLGFGGLLLIFLAARRLFPDDPALAVFATGFTALLPMRQAITASVGNDVLTEACFSLTLLLLIEAFRNGMTAQRAAYIGFAFGGALLTKATGLLLLPVVLAALLLLAREGETVPTLWKGGVIIFAMAALMSAGWFARNRALYHEFAPVRAFVHEFEGTAKARDWIGKQTLAVNFWTGDLQLSNTMTREGYLMLIANWTFRTFWAAYTPAHKAAVGAPEFLPPSFYALYGIFTFTALAGLVRLHFRRKSEFSGLQRKVIFLLFLTIFLVVVSFGGFVWTFFQAQGRYLYPAMLPLSLMAALGLRAVLPTRYRNLGMALTLALFFLLALAFLLTVMNAYS